MKRVAGAPAIRKFALNLVHLRAETNEVTFIRIRIESDPTALAD